MSEQPPGAGRPLPAEGDVIVLARRPGDALRAGDLVLERRPVRPPGPGEVVVHNLVTTVDPYQLRMLRGSTEIVPVNVGDPVAANSVGIVVQSRDPAVPVGTQVVTYTGWHQRVRPVISEFDGLARAPEALASLFERGTSYLGRRVVRIAPQS